MYYCLWFLSCLSRPLTTFLAYKSRTAAGYRLEGLFWMWEHCRTVPPWNQPFGYESVGTFWEHSGAQQQWLDQVHLETNPPDCPGFPVSPGSAFITDMALNPLILLQSSLEISLGTVSILLVHIKSHSDTPQTMQGGTQSPLVHSPHHDSSWPRDWSEALHGNVHLKTDPVLIHTNTAMETLQYRLIR